MEIAISEFKAKCIRLLKEASTSNLFFEDALLSHEVAMQSDMLPGNFHKDPADRILVATARMLNCPLLTADDLILAYPHVASMDARR